MYYAHEMTHGVLIGMNASYGTLEDTVRGLTGDHGVRITDGRGEVISLTWHGRTQYTEAAYTCEDGTQSNGGREDEGVTGWEDMGSDWSDGGMSGQSDWTDGVCVDDTTNKDKGEGETCEGCERQGESTTTTDRDTHLTDLYLGGLDRTVNGHAAPTGLEGIEGDAQWIARRIAAVMSDEGY